MKWLIPLLFAPMVYASTVLLLWDRHGQYLYNSGPFFHSCRLIVPGRYQPVYWDLYPGQRTISYRRIEYFECR